MHYVCTSHSYFKYCDRDNCILYKLIKTANNNLYIKYILYKFGIIY